MSLTWSPVLSPGPDPLPSDERWAHDLIDRILFGRKASRLTPAGQKTHDVTYLVKGLVKREIHAIERQDGRYCFVSSDELQASKTYYTPIASQICDLLAADDPEGAEALLVATITIDLPTRVAQHAANAELAGIA